MKKYIYKFEAMSTPCEIIVYSPTKLLADKSADAILLETKRLEKKYNYYDSDSFLWQLNTRQVCELDQESKTLLSRAKKYYKLTNKTFDITIATLKDIYKNSLSQKELEEKKKFLLPYLGCEHFSIKKDKIYFDNEYSKIDLGGFVKEYAVDRAVVILKRHKINAALVNFGGDIYALGRKPDGGQFKLGIKNPHNPKELIKEVLLENQALTTSASYERNYTIEGDIYSHIIAINERNSSFTSVSVISKNCVESGVYSTSLMINDSLEIKGEKICLK